ncbi:MAG: hypothetical protein U0164_19035 [Gemmatimonadaceae bacterium]
MTDTVTQRLLRALEVVAGTEPAWGDYSVGRHPLLLKLGRVESDASWGECLAVWRQARPLDAFVVDSQPPLSTPLYGLLDLDTLGSGAEASPMAELVKTARVSRVLGDALRAREVTRVVVIPAPLRLGDLGALGSMLQQQGADPVQLQLYLAVHEGFHLQSQFPTWLGQTRAYFWPAWDLQPDRKQVVSRCYGGADSVVVLVRTEQVALRAAWAALMPDSGGTTDRTEARRQAARFVEARSRRYQILAQVRVGAGAAARTCADAESIMELEEGSAHWIAHTAIVRAGLLTASRMRRSYEHPQPEMFYPLGSMQLWVLEGWLGRQTMRSLTDRIAHSAGPDAAIYFEFRSALLRGGA